MIYSSRLYNHFFKSTFGIGNRFENAHSYLKNNPPLTGRLKKYSSATNIFCNNKNKDKRNNSFICINTKRTINPSYSVNLDETNYKRGKKFHCLSQLNNKSSSCINPDYFNPLINYRHEEKTGKKKIRRNYETNKDHFINMTPTQLYIYKPHTKQSMYNYYLISQIDSLPGSRQSRIGKIAIKKTGKKTFNKNLFEESKGTFYRNNNNNNFKYKNFTAINNKFGKISKVYEFDNPIITHRDMNKKKYN